MYNTCRIKGFKALRIQEFIQGRNVKYGTVTQYIKRHSDVFKDHIGRSKGKVELDDFAVIELDKIYPFPQPVEVIEDVEARKALIEAQQKIIDLQEQLNKALPMLAEAKYRESLLESETARANKAESEKIDNLKQLGKINGNYQIEQKINVLLEQQLDDKKKQIDELKREAFKLKKENEILKKRTLFERMRNKDISVTEEYKENFRAKSTEMHFKQQISDLRDKQESN